MEQLIINTLDEFREFVTEDRQIYGMAEESFAKSWYNYSETHPMGKLNRLSAEYVYDDFISEAYCDKVTYNMDREKAIEWIAEEFAVTFALAQNGKIV
jgi:hypothetical protein